MLFRQTLLYLPAQVVGPVVQFISIVLWTYFLDPSEMGVLALITAAQEFGYIATLFWFTLFTMRYFDKTARAEERTDYLNTESAVMLLATALSAVGALALPLFIDVPFSLSLAGASISYCASRTIATQLTDRARTALDTATYSFMQITWPILGLALGVLFVKVFAATAANVLWGYATAQALALGVALARIGIGKNPLALSKDMVSTALTYGMPLVIGGLFVWLANNGLRFVIERQAGAAAVGLVTVGWGLGLRAAAFAAMLVTAAAFPLAVSRARESGMAEGQAQLVRNGVLLLGILAPAAAGLWAISHPLVERLVAEPFREMTSAVLPWAILAGAVRNMRIHFGEQVFLLREETRVPLVNDLIDGLTTIACAALGLVYGGLPGSVQGAAVGAILSLAITLICGAHWHKFTFPISHLVRIFGATAIMMGAVTLLPTGADLISLGTAVALGGAVYASALALFYPGGALHVLSKVKELRQA